MRPDPIRWFRGPLATVAKFALGAALLAILWRKGLIDPARIATAFSEHPWTMAVAVGTHGLVFLFLALRWRLFARAGRIVLSTTLSLRLTLTSHFFSTCLPGNGAGDLVKAWILSRSSGAFTPVLGTIVLDRAMGMAGLFTTWAIFLAAALATRPESTRLLLPFLALAVLSAAAFLGAIVFSRRILAVLDRMDPADGTRRARLVRAVRDTVEPIAAGGASRKLLAAGLCLSLANQGSQIATAWLAGRILSIPADLVACGAVLPLVSLVNAIPLSPGGLGLGESTGAAAMREFGLAPNAGGQIVLVVRIASVFWALAGLACYLSLRPPKTGDSAPQR
jgi:glycosyltransferase 2 family protein